MALDRKRIGIFFGRVPVEMLGIFGSDIMLIIGRRPDFERCRFRQVENAASK